MPQLIRLTGIEAAGRHGASAGERDEPQRFVFDVEVVVEATDDDLASTADYREIVTTVREIVEGGSWSLIETIASRVADAVGAVNGVLSCRVVVHKPEAASRLELTDVSAEVTARRPS